MTETRFWRSSNSAVTTAQYRISPTRWRCRWRRRRRGFRCRDSPMDAGSQRELARRLATLRKEGRQQSGMEPRLIPPDKETAYRVARMVEEELGWEVAGWKIAGAKADMQKALRTDSPIYGRVYAPLVEQSPVTLEYSRQCSPIPEAEYEAVLGADLPPRKNLYSIAEVMEAVVSLHPGMELAEFRFVRDAAYPPLTVILADGAGSGTIAYGPPIEIGGSAIFPARKLFFFATGRRSEEALRR